MKAKIYAVHLDSHANPYFLIKAFTKKQIKGHLHNAFGVWDKDIEEIDCLGIAEELPHINHDIELSDYIS